MLRVSWRSSCEVVRPSALGMALRASTIPVCPHAVQSSEGLRSRPPGQPCAPMCLLTHRLYAASHRIEYRITSSLPISNARATLPLARENRTSQTQKWLSIEALHHPCTQRGLLAISLASIER